MSADPTDFPETAGSDVAGRAMLVRAARPVRLECVARGYLFGSAWSDYEETGSVQGRDAPVRASRRPSGSRRRSSRPPPRPRRATTSRSPTSRPPRSWATSASSSSATSRCASTSSAPSSRVERGLILADTKLEFGTVDDELLVIDEMLTPDSSRYWPAEDYRVGASPPSFDKQYVRDHYLSIGWNLEPPAPRLPATVIDATRSKYVEAYELVTGASFDEWYGRRARSEHATRRGSTSRTFPACSTRRARRWSARCPPSATTT